MAFLILVALAIFLDKSIDDTNVGLGVWVVVILVLIWLSIWPFLNWLFASYTVTTRRLITRYGVITRRGHDIPLTRISDVAYEKDLIDRLLGCGTLVISDASTHGQVPAARHPARRGAAARAQRPVAPAARRHPGQ